MKENFFSIVIPVKAYNAYCEESLGTCSRLYPDQEILFSPDEPCRVPFAGVTVLPSGPVGPSYKRDLCMRQARGEVLAFLDDDAYPEKGWLEAAEEIFADPQVAAVGGPAVTPPADSPERWASGLVYQSFLVGGPHGFRYVPRAARLVDDYPTCNLLVRRDVMLSIGGFDTGFWPGEDTVACLKIVHDLKKKIVYSPRVLVYHHRRSMYGGHLKQVKSYALHRGFFVKRFPKTSLRPSYFLPSLLLAGAVFGWLPAVFWRPWILLWLAGMGFYALAAVFQGLVSIGQAPSDLRGWSLFSRVVSGIAATHFAYGFFFLKGLFSPSLSEQKPAV